MKRAGSICLILLLLMTSFAFCEGGIIMCYNCTVNGLSTLSFPVSASFTAVATLSEGQQITGWKLNGEVVDGEVSESFVFTANGTTVIEALIDGDPGKTNAPADPDAAKKPVRKQSNTTIVQAYGATLQYLDAKGNGAGETYTELDFSEVYTNPVTGEECPARQAAFKVTADSPHSSTIDYWVIDGVRYDFVNTVKYITVTGLTEDMTIEVVYKKGSSQTLKSENKIQEMRTSEELIVSCENAKMRHVKNASATAGDAFTEFDFTQSYTNKATGKTEKGGAVTVKVSANLSKVDYWEFGTAKLVFSNNAVTYFFARNLDRSMKYVPHYGNK